MLTLIHRSAAIIAMLCIAIFFSATLIVELAGNNESITLVKSLIVMPGLFILVPAIAATGGTGFALSKRHSGRLVTTKKRRMPIIGANGLIILLPSAILLDQWAAAGAFDVQFYSLQVLELIAGATNLTLMFFNARDGLKLSGKFRD